MFLGDPTLMCFRYAPLHAHRPVSWVMQLIYQTVFSEGLSDQAFSPSLPSHDSENSKEAKPRLNPESVFDVKHLPMTRDSLVGAQKADLSLSKFFNNIKNSDSTNNKDTMYFIENGLLLRRWRDRRDGDSDSSAVVQVVIPSKHRQSVLSLAHDNVWAGHLGVAKTYDRVLRHFFWPGLKKDVTHFCRTCPMSGGWKTKPGYPTCSTSPDSSSR